MPRRQKPREKTEEVTPAVRFKPKTERQKLAVNVFDEHALTFLLGPAGTGKTHLAVYLALKELQEQRIPTRERIEKIVITRPIVEAGEHLGALPGEMDEKVHPYMLPVYDCVAKMVGNSDKYIDTYFEIAPLAYMRGRTFANSVVILDEAQNCTETQLTLFMSRLGEGSKMIVSGDTDQSDIGRYSGLRPWVAELLDCAGIGFVHFTEDDIVRHPLVKEILKRRPRSRN
jgi:phosphate starvation-inducible PhoH-like protein